MSIKPKCDGNIERIWREGVNSSIANLKRQIEGIKSNNRIIVNNLQPMFEKVGNSYIASVLIHECKDNMIPHVFFEVEDIETGKYSSWAKSLDGKVVFQSDDNEEITIPTIVLEW